jgi:serine/threonine protein kinase/Tol biopolymer transport system component
MSAAEDEFHRIESLFHDALERDPEQRSAFLDRACAGEDGVRAGVERMLARADSETDPDQLRHGIEGLRVAHEASPHSLVSGVDGGISLETGQILLQYRIDQKIGEGGMGVVWSARDTSLDRDVAIKVLPGAFATDRSQLSRFRREAKLLASLNHSNIAAIYGLHHAESVHFLAMELIPGQDLGARLAHGRMPVDESVHVARQIAAGLEAAHENGVIHRDLKPANVQLVTDGQAKVLDFGLAKSIEGAAMSSDPSMTATQTGQIMGTVSYMSPEQARGHPVDKRSDIWSFGCVLYEMLTGQQAFEGDTISDTLVAVLTKAPQLDELPGDVPPGLRALLERCLTRDRNRRLRDIGEARIALERIERGEDTAESPGHGQALVGWRTIWPWAIVATVLVSALAGGYLLGLGGQPAPGLNADVRMRKLTYAPGLEQEPALSPDGNYFAYTTDDSGNLDIIVSPSDGGDPKRVVSHPADDAQPAWSPDGTRLAFVSAREGDGNLNIISGLGQLSQFTHGDDGDIFLVSALGGRAVKLVDDGCNPAWSPDGTRIVFQSRRSGQWALWTINTTGGNAELLIEEAEPLFDPTWSPDGRHVAYVNLDHGLSVVPSEGGEPRRVAGQGRLYAGPAWSADGRWIFVSSDRASAPGVLNLWRIPFAASNAARAMRMTLGEGNDIDAAAGSQGGRVALAAVHFSSDIWELDVASGAMSQVTRDTSDESYPHVSPDGSMLAMESDRSGVSRAVWTVQLPDGLPSRLSLTDADAYDPRWSPGGGRMAYVRREPSSWSLVIHTLGGVSSEAVRTSRPGVLGAPDWSRDGKWLAYHDAAPGESVIASWIQEIGGEARRLVDDGVFPTWSPSDDLIAFQRGEGVQRQIWTIATAGGEARQLTSDEHEHSHPQWSPTDPDRILMVLDHKNLATASVRTGVVTPLTFFDESTVRVDYPTWSFDGTKIYFSLVRRVGDIYTLENY